MVYGEMQQTGVRHEKIARGTCQSIESVQVIVHCAAPGVRCEHFAVEDLQTHGLEEVQGA